MGVALLVGAAPPAQAQRSAIERVKAGVVVVGTFQRTRSPPFRFLGTGFAVDDGGSIATNAHVVAERLKDDTDPEVFAIMLPSTTAGQATVVEVTRSAVDEEHDLAVLKLKTGRLPPLRLSEDDAVSDGDEFLFTGFPIGAVLGPIAATHRAMISAVTPIVIPVPTGDRLDPSLVRRLQRGPFPVYQLDGTAYPGNSGSPLYDRQTGTVVGIVNMVFVKGLKENALAQPSGISYAIPIRHLRELLARMR
ncbi:MAG TPA: serine protease [Burkholderiaceae bacterium]|nr:serine protease [Burkholderiaceae bacterium]